MQQMLNQSPLYGRVTKKYDIYRNNTKKPGYFGNCMIKQTKTYFSTHMVLGMYLCFNCLLEVLYRQKIKRKTTKLLIKKYYFLSGWFPNEILKNRSLWYSYNSISRSCSIKRHGLNFFQKSLLNVQYDQKNEGLHILSNWSYNRMVRVDGKQILDIKKQI